MIDTHGVRDGIYSPIVLIENQANYFVKIDL